MNYNLISNILGGKWLIEPGFAEATLGLVLSVLKGGSMPQMDKEKMKVFSAQHPRLISAYQDWGFKNTEIAENSIALIPVEGPIMKASGWCNTGTMEMAEWVKQAESNPKISQILFIVDSPGGMVDGTSTLGDAIKATTKKTIAFIEDGMAASAGYWIASACSEIWSSHATNMVGSIGVYVSMADWKKYYAKEGLDIHEVYSTYSTEKNKDFHEALKGNYKMLQEGMLDPIAEVFIAHVKETRGDKLNASAGDPFKGGIYTSDKALNMGLIDRIGSLAELLGELEQSSSNQFSQSNKNQMKFKSAWAAIMGAIGFGSVASEDEAPNVTEERLELLNSSLEAANSKLADQKAANDKLQAEYDQKESDLKAANSAKEEADKKVSALEAEKTELEAEVARLGKQPGATHGNPSKGNEDLGEEVISEAEQFASYDHNKEALNEIKDL